MAVIPRKRLFVGFSSVDSTIKGTQYQDLELIKRDLVNHFYTRKGERLMNAQFGCIIWDLMFEPMTDDIVNLIVEDATQIVQSDGRVVLKDINLVQYDHGVQLQMNLLYTPLDIVDQFSLDFDRRNLESTEQ
jgi:phage baseplate assembly protein W